MWRRVLGEAVIMFFLVFTVGASDGDTFAIGGIIWCLFIVNGGVSFAMMSPVVTLSFILKLYLHKKLTREIFIEYLLYILAQFVFSFLGALASLAVRNHSLHVDVKEGYMVAETFFGEVIYTCAIVGNGHMVGRLTDNYILIAAVISMTVTAGIWTIGSSAGYCFNPAIGLGINLVGYFHKGQELGRIWIYIFGPSLGAILGVFMSEFFGSEVDRIKERKMKGLAGGDEGRLVYN